VASAGLKIQLKLTILTQTYWKSPLLRPLVKFQENKEEMEKMKKERKCRIDRNL